MSDSSVSSSPSYVVWTRIPIVGLPDFVCTVKVTKDGRALDADGEPLPFDVRPNECGKDGTWFLGSRPLCATHARETAHLMEDDIDEIAQAWRDRRDGE